MNHLDQNSLSTLFKLLFYGYAAHDRSMIRKLLQEGAVIKNGYILAPLEVPKRLTEQASAENIKKIFHTLKSYDPDVSEHDILVEIGAGDGYLRYLMSLSLDPEIHRIAEKIVETEASSTVVETNVLRGKYTICLGIADLPNHFGEKFTPCIISLNVLDVFSKTQLCKYLRTIYRVLKNEGMLLHIMSSAIHRQVFEDLRESYSDALHLPLYYNGHVGIRLVSPQSSIKNAYESFPKDAEELATLFAMSPDTYIQLAEKITRWFEQSGEKSQSVLLDQFSFDKILQALQQNGFHILWNEEVHSRVCVPRTLLHSEFDGINAFHNCLGALKTFSQTLEHPDLILEESTFRVILARKVP